MFDAHDKEVSILHSKGLFNHTFVFTLFSFLCFKQSDSYVFLFNDKIFNSSKNNKTNSLLVILLIRRKLWNDRLSRNRSTNQ